MIEIWDYFMRRKGLLLVVLAVFFVSSIFSYRVLQDNTTEPTSTYISVDHWGIEELEVPKTGGEINSRMTFSVMNPNQVVEIKNFTNPEVENSENIPYEIVTQPENIVSTNSSISSTTSRPKYNLFYSFFLIAMGVLIMILGSYLTYWHFRR